MIRSQFDHRIRKAQPQRLINIWFKTADVAIGRKDSSRFALGNLAYKAKQKAIQQNNVFKKFQLWQDSSNLEKGNYDRNQTVAFLCSS